jgi:hypothetical protein
MANRPAVNPDVHDIADRAKHRYAIATQLLAATRGYWGFSAQGRLHLRPPFGRDKRRTTSMTRPISALIRAISAWPACASISACNFSAARKPVVPTGRR